MAATATMRIIYTASSLEPAALDWTDDYDSGNYMDDAARLRDASTSIHLPLTDIEGGDTEQWPEPFSRWIEDTLREFVHESCRSRAKRATSAEVWEAVERAARADTATAVNDDQVRLGFLRLPGNKPCFAKRSLLKMRTRRTFLTTKRCERGMRHGPNTTIECEYLKTT
jgi:hypothetical protein